jgi:hypothetical protein
VSIIKFELPDNNASVLHHIGNALQAIASDLSQGYDFGPTVKADIKPKFNETAPELDETYVKEDLTTTVVDQEYNPLTDAEGIPWDQRIHSKGKTRNGDNTWRLVRKPKDMTDAQFDEFVKNVKAELKSLMAIPVADDLDDGLAALFNDENPFENEPLDLPTDIVTPPVVDIPVVVTPPVVETPVVVVPPAIETPVVVAPPVVDTPDVVTPPAVVTDTGDGVKTFGGLMKFITSNNKKLTPDQVKQVVATAGVASLPLLASRVDLIPQIHKALKALL